MEKFCVLIFGFLIFCYGQGRAEEDDQVFSDFTGFEAETPDSNTKSSEDSYPPPPRCMPGQKIDFFIIKNTELQGSDVSMGVLPAYECMRQCIESTMMFCQSIEINRTSGECFMVEETSDAEKAIGSSEFDIYEPMCINEEIKTPCDGLYLFEKVENVNLVTEDLISQHRDHTKEACMEKCLTNEHCLSFIYGKTDQRCKLFSVNRYSNYTRAVMDTSVDMYELSCDRINGEIWKPSAPSELPKMPSANIPSVNPEKPAIFKGYDQNLKAARTLDGTQNNKNDLFSPQDYPQPPPGQYTRNFAPAPEPSAPGLPSRPAAVIRSPSVGSVSHSTPPPQPYAPALPAIPSAYVKPPSVGGRREGGGANLPSVALGAPSERPMACGEPQSILIENGRIFRQEYRSLHHVNVRNLTQCEKLCALSNIECAAYAYGHQNMDCILTTKSVESGRKLDYTTQWNPNYDLYAFLGASKCFEMMDGQENIRITTLSTTLSPPPSKSSAAAPGSKPDKPGAEVELEKSKKLAVDNTNWTEKSEIPEIFDDRDVFEVETEETEFITSTISTFKKVRFNATTYLPTAPGYKDKTSARNQQKEKIHGSKLENIHRSQQIDVITIPHTPEILHRVTETPELPYHEQVKVTETPEIPHRVPETPEMKKINTEKVVVKAICLERGVNVTFNTNGTNYTGAVYAAERFSQCRIFVENKNHFHIFISRPKYNNWCNALELENTLNAVIVMSNDLVMPYDVTTKDDFFYQITCDYKQTPNPSIVHSGIVVGGPEPKSISASIKQQDEQRTYVILQILKNGDTVSNVFIGEKLTALIESDVNPGRLRVVDCNATRVGGREPKPESVQLIKDGCTMMPQVIGNMAPGKGGLQAPLTAFRIDGSDQIDILCSVIICKEKCEPKDSCSANRNRRGTKIEVKDIDDKITVDHRLRVLVQDDPNKFIGENSSFRDFCINPNILLLTLGLLVLTLVALAVSMCSNQCRKRIGHRTLSDTSEINFHQTVSSLPRFGNALI